MMLFQCSVELADSHLPASFLKIIISEFHYPPLPNCTELNFLYPSGECWDSEFGVVDKEKYFSFLYNNLECMASILTIMKALQGNENVAILTSEQEMGLLFTRYFCEFIFERYGYVSFPFYSMDAITLNMRRLSCTTEKGEETLLQDLAIFSTGV